MIIHISNERNTRILEQGFKITVPERLQQDYCYEYGVGDTVYHLLPDERGICSVCNEEFESVPAETPVDLEVVKVVLAQEPNASVEELRRYINSNHAA